MAITQFKFMVLSAGLLALSTGTACTAPTEPAIAETAPALAPAGDVDLAIRDFVGRVEVSQTAAPGVTASVTPARNGPGGSVTQAGDTVVVTGGMPLQRISCYGDGEARTITVNGQRFRDDQLPVLTISGPADMKVEVNRSMLDGSLGRVASADLGIVGCGALTLDAVARDLTVSHAGSGPTTIGDVGGSAELNLANSGETTLGTVRGALAINLAGSGDVSAAATGGPLEVSVAGSGDVRVVGGEGPTAISIAGSGSVSHGGIAVEPSVSIVGSGDVRLAKVRGTPEIARIGSGTVTIGAAVPPTQPAR